MNDSAGMCSVPCGPKRALKPIPPPSQTASASPTKVSSPDASMAAGRVCKDARIDGSLRVSVGLEPPPLELGMKGCSLSGRYPASSHPPPTSLRVRGGSAAPLGPVDRRTHGPEAHSPPARRAGSATPSRLAKARQTATIGVRDPCPRLSRRAGVRPLQSAPGASVPRHARRTGVRPLPSASGAGVPRLSRRAGVRSLSAGVRGQSPAPPRRAGVRPHPVTQPQPRHSTRARARQLTMASGVQATLCPSRTFVPSTGPQHPGRCPAARDRSWGPGPAPSESARTTE